MRLEGRRLPGKAHKQSVGTDTAHWGPAGAAWHSHSQLSPMQGSSGGLLRGRPQSHLQAHLLIATSAASSSSAAPPRSLARLRSQPRARRPDVASGAVPCGSQRPGLRRAQQQHGRTRGAAGGLNPNPEQPD